VVAGIGATGFVGIAFEAVAGTYTAPTKYVPIKSESLQYNAAKYQRRDIRGIADVLGTVRGDENPAGDLMACVYPTVLPYFLYASRGAVVKTGTGPWTYTWTPGHGAMPTTGRTLSITVVRNGIVFGYVGCVVGVSEYSLDNGILQVRHGIVGRNEAVQSLPTATWPTDVPFGKGMYDVEIPTGTDVCDVDTFTLTIDDSASAEFRLCGDTGAEFIRFGERSVSLNVGRDFDSRTDYDGFKAITAQAIKIQASNGASADVKFDLPVAIKDTYELGLNGQGDLVRANISYIGTYDATTGAAGKITVIANENIT